VAYATHSTLNNSIPIYEYIGILLGARPILHISRIKVKGMEVSDTDLRPKYLPPVLQSPDSIPSCTQELESLTLYIPVLQYVY
jgi:hypothetical protein